MKKFFLFLAWLSFIAFCILMVVKEFDAVNLQRQIITEVVNQLDGPRELRYSEIYLIRNQPELIIALWLNMIILFISALVLGSSEKLKFKPNYEYEILKWSKEPGRHLMVIGYFDECQHYYSGIIEWDGDIEFHGNSDYLHAKYFISKNMRSLSFSEVTH